MLLPIGINAGDGGWEMGDGGHALTRDAASPIPHPLNSLEIILICHHNRVGIGQQAARDPLAQRAGLWKQVWRQQIVRGDDDRRPVLRAT